MSKNSLKSNLNVSRILLQKATLSDTKARLAAQVPHAVRQDRAWLASCCLLVLRLAV